MTNKILQTLLLVAMGVIALLFLKLMFDMSRSMNQLTDYIGAMTEDIQEMQSSMDTMNTSMQNMEKSITGMGQAFTRGSEQFQRMNPSSMMQGFPGSRQSN